VNPQWTLRRRLMVLWVLIATVFTFLAVGAGATALANRGELEVVLTDIVPMRVASNDLLQALVDQEAGVRGYVTSGAEADLAPYLQGIAVQRRTVEEIAANPSANASVQQQLAAIADLTDTWRRTVAEPAIAAMRNGDRRTAQAALNADARAQFAEIRSTVSALQATMQGMQDQAASSMRDTNTTLLFVLVVAALLVIASGIGIMVALQRTVIGPLTDLAAQVQAVAQGAYDRAISTFGPPEFERLAGDVDLMRRQIATDLTEVRRARRLIEAANTLLEQQAAELTRSNRDLEQFAYVASHDLQEPLRKVASFCQLLQRRYAGQLDERADEYIAFAVNGAQRMQRLIEDLLAFSRIGRHTTGFTQVDLGRLVVEVVAELDGAADATITATDLPVVEGEEPLLATLLANLVSNSLKFRRPDQPSQVHLAARPVQVRSAGPTGPAGSAGPVGSAGRAATDMCEISCVDNGIGIEPEFVDKVFVIFQRLHPRNAYPGTGIGLAVAKKIVEYHGGDIWVDADYRDGAAIRFTLPMAAQPASATPLGRGRLLPDLQALPAYPVLPMHRPICRQTRWPARSQTPCPARRQTPCPARHRAARRSPSDDELAAAIDTPGGPAGRG
jgi:signal transduction histidine kinase